MDTLPEYEGARAHYLDLGPPGADHTFLLLHGELRNITLVVQDWGGTLRLTLPVDPGFRSHLDRLIVMNTVLPVGEPLVPHYYEWRSLIRNIADPPVGHWMRDAAPQLTEAEVAAYDAPYPDSRSKAGPRTFPDLAMVEPQMDGVAEAQAALRFWAEEWSSRKTLTPTRCTRSRPRSAAARTR